MAPARTPSSRLHQRRDAYRAGAQAVQAPSAAGPTIVGMLEWITKALRDPSDPRLVPTAVHALSALLVRRMLRPHHSAWPRSCKTCSNELRMQKHMRGWHAGLD